MPTKSNNIGGRGGKRPGAGRKKTAIREKADNGNPGGRRLTVLDIPEIEGAEMPKPHDFLSAEQRDGSQLQAEEIFRETWGSLLLLLGVCFLLQSVAEPIICHKNQIAKILIYYDENTWSFTKLASIGNTTKEALLDVFGEGNVTIRFWIECYVFPCCSFKIDAV